MEKCNGRGDVYDTNKKEKRESWLKNLKIENSLDLNGFSK